MGKKWQNGTPDDHSDDLDVEHGSVNEISSVVASTGERMAEIMPGILLILGLLGTFLGLGMALNKASSILIDANSAGMDSAMSNLMGMMEGLGTKFKTSTWGITAFLFLKIFSAANGYEEKRLRWCAHKMKRVFEQVRMSNKIEQEKNQQFFIDAYKCLEERLVLQTTAINQSSNYLFDGLQPLLSEIISQGNESQIARHKANEQLIVLSSTSEKLFQTMLHGVELLNQQTVLAKELLFDTKNMKSSLEGFIASNSENLNAIGQSANQMATAALDVGNSANDLQLAIAGFKDGVAELLTTIKTDLGVTINQMGHSFSQNMGIISQNMADATQGISTAVSELSENVGTTMTNVQVSIDDSMNIQRTAQREFMVTSETLNEKVIAMTKLVDDLRERIVDGLSAVSQSGRRMASLNTHFENITSQGEKNVLAIENMITELKVIQKSNPLDYLITQIIDVVNRVAKNVEVIESKLSESTTSEKVAEVIEVMDSALLTLKDIEVNISNINFESLQSKVEKTISPLEGHLERIHNSLISLKQAELVQ